MPHRKRVTIAAIALIVGLGDSVVAGTVNVPVDFATIQAAIDAAVSGADEVVVAPGTYNEAIDFLGKAVTLRSSGGRDVTTIDGNGASHVVQCVNGEGPDTILDGFTITGGDATGSPFPNSAGGGMLNLDSSPTVTNCTFSGNTSHDAIGGGGMYNGNSSPTVTNCTFSGNTGGAGGGMYNGNSSPTVTNCTFIGNTVIHDGGGMANVVSNPTVTNCRFDGNTAGVHGGGMASFPGNPTVTNCAFSGNTANERGGGMSIEGGNPTVTNCTFSGNTAADLGGGMYTGSADNPTVTNCILWGDSPNEIFVIGSSTYSFNDVQGIVPGPFDGGGNISDDPLFFRPPDDGGDGWGDDPGTPGVDEGANDDFGDLHLLPGSPSIDEGNDAAVPPDITDLDGNGDTTEQIPFDLDGNDRFVGQVDMGAYETQPGPEPPLLAPPPHDVLKNRYISIDPRGAGGANAGVDFDIRLTLTETMVSGVTAVGSEWWANDPDANCISTVGSTRPGVPPDWDACPTLHLTGCPIIPTSTYSVVLIEGSAVSDPPLAAETQAQPAGNKWWGDAVGFFNGSSWTGPQGVTSFEDVTAALKTFQDPNAVNATHTSVTDIHPNQPTLPPPANQINKLVNIDDVFNFIKAFQGDEYPGPEIELCP